MRPMTASTSECIRGGMFQDAVRGSKSAWAHTLGGSSSHEHVREKGSTYKTQETGWAAYMMGTNIVHPRTCPRMGFDL